MGLLWNRIRAALYPSGPHFPASAGGLVQLPDARLRLTCPGADGQTTYIGLLSFRFRKPFTMR